MHEDETPLSEETVRLLVDEQFPEWRDLPIGRVTASGTVNSIFRIGDDEWRRGMAWAFVQSMGVIWYYRETNPVMSRMGRLTLERLCAHAGQLG